MTCLGELTSSESVEQLAHVTLSEKLGHAFFIFLPL